MTTYYIKVGRKKYKKLKGHFIDYHKGYAEITRDDEQVTIIPIKGKTITIEPKWLLNKNEHIKQISKRQACLD